MIVMSMGQFTVLVAALGVRPLPNTACAQSPVPVVDRKN